MKKRFSFVSIIMITILAFTACNGNTQLPSDTSTDDNTQNTEDSSSSSASDSIVGSWIHKGSINIHITFSDSDSEGIGSAYQENGGEIKDRITFSYTYADNILTVTASNDGEGYFGNGTKTCTINGDTMVLTWSGQDLTFTRTE